VLAAAEYGGGVTVVLASSWVCLGFRDE